MPELKKVEVTWLDAWFQPSEMTYKEVEDLSAVTRQNIGYLVKGTENDVILAAGRLEKIPGGEDSFCDIVIIPRAVVKEIRILND